MKISDFEKVAKDMGVEYKICSNILVVYPPHTYEDVKAEYLRRCKR